ncbi:unnamed protein product [Brassica rapa]|uniref:Uncharacterized protein n=2 Tax=Brassica campestris TaxID=3711 RepID=A0A8D9GCW7_BRACM|nr:unnamed protein product [Brassica rapa]
MDSPLSDQPIEYAVKSYIQHIPQRIHKLQEGISVRPITIDQKTIASKVIDVGPIFSVHPFSPQNYKNLLRLATTPTYLPGKLLLSSSPASNFYFNKSIDYIKHFKGRIRDHSKACSKE